MSLTLRDATLQQRSQLEAYQLANRLPSGSLPSIWLLTDDDLSAAQLVAEPCPLADDPAYGHLHFETECPTDGQAETLAIAAEQNGCLLEGKRAK